jgi:hypothetical protein
VIALVGTLRYREHRSVPEIHQQLQLRRLPICQRTVEHLLQRYEELVALHVQQRERIIRQLNEQGRALLALDGLQPDVGHEVLWVIREILSGEILLARPLLSGAQEDLAQLLQEVQQIIPVPIEGILSDGQLSIRAAVATVFPQIPHQLCQFHFLREAAKPIAEADRHAKKELKKQVRGVRPLEHQLEQSKEKDAEIMRQYCVAVRAALTDDGRPPLAAAGLRLQTRLTQIRDSLQRVAEKRGCPSPWNNYICSSARDYKPQQPCGSQSNPFIIGSMP